MKKTPIQQVSRTETIPSPTGGLNTRSPISNMPINTALQMTNAIPTALGVSARKGFTLFKNGYTNIESMFKYVGTGVSTDRLFVADSGSIKDTATVSPIANKSGFTNSKFRTVQLGTQGGQFLVVCNGEQVPAIFNGTSWIDFSVSASPAAIGQFTIVGSFTLDKLINPIVHQKRLWFVIKNSTRIAYGDINSLGGTLTSFDLSGLMPRGGFVKEICSWSSDGGSGLQNRLAICTSEGDVILFSGPDPSIAGSFTNDGVWSVSKPSPRAFIPFDGDVLYFCERGLFPLSSYLQNSTTVSPISLNVSNTLGELVRMNKDYHGFDFIQASNENLLILNVPQMSLANNVQFVLQTETLGWSLFTGIPASCWCELNGDMYFAGGTSIWNAFTGYQDNNKSYVAVIQQAFSDLGSASMKKHVKLARVNLISSTTKNSLQMSIRSDFDTSAPANIPSIATGTSALWDSARFDHDVFGAENISVQKWSGTSALGSYISVVLVMQVVAETIWTSSDLVFEVGGIL